MSVAEDEGVQPYQPIILQTSGIDWARARYDAKLWLLILLYIPFTSAAILIITGNIMVLALESLFVVVAMSFIFNTLQEKKRQASRGNYVDSRTNFPDKEIIEQMKVVDIITEAKPANPYPFHTALIGNEEWVNLLTNIGDDYVIYEAGAAKKQLKQQIDKAVEERVQEILTCKRCGMVFMNDKDYNKHLKKCKEEVEIMCPTCNVILTSMKAYNKHVKKCKPTIFICSICNQAFDREKKYTEHLDTHAKKPEGDNL